MKIKVIYPNGVGQVEPAELEKLIEEKKILAFVRSNRLVVIDIHPTRKRESEWPQQERRSGT